MADRASAFTFVLRRIRGEALRAESVRLELKVRPREDGVSIRAALRARDGRAVAPVREARASRRNRGRPSSRAEGAACRARAGAPATRSRRAHAVERRSSRGMGRDPTRRGPHPARAPHAIPPNLIWRPLADGHACPAADQAPHVSSSEAVAASEAAPGRTRCARASAPAACRAPCPDGRRAGLYRRRPGGMPGGAGSSAARARLRAGRDFKAIAAAGKDGEEQLLRHAERGLQVADQHAAVGAAGTPRRRAALMWPTRARPCADSANVEARAHPAWGKAAEDASPQRRAMRRAATAAMCAKLGGQEVRRWPRRPWAPQPLATGPWSAGGSDGAAGRVGEEAERAPRAQTSRQRAPARCVGRDFVVVASKG